MPGLVSRTGYLALLCGLIAAGGGTAADAAGIGMNVRAYVHNIPQAVAGGRHPHLSTGAGEQPARPHRKTRGIRNLGTGVSPANNFPK